MTACTIYRSPGADPGAGMGRRESYILDETETPMDPPLESTAKFCLFSDFIMNRYAACEA